MPVAKAEQQARLRSFLLTQADWIPVYDAHEFPGVLVKLELELAFLIDDQLSGRVEKARALFLVGVVQVEFACGQIISGGIRTSIDFAKSDSSVGGKANFTTRISADQANVSEVRSGRARDGYTTDGLHFR